MNLRIDAKKWREEHNLIYPDEYKQIVSNNYHLMMVDCFFIGVATNEIFHML